MSAPDFKNKNPQTPRPSIEPPRQTPPQSPPLPRSESSCLTITIVGVLGDEVPDHTRLVAIGTEIQRVVVTLFPSFRPGYPPISVSFTTLPEVRQLDAQAE